MQIYFRRFKVEALQKIMGMTVLFFGLSVPLMFSLVARFFSMFFIIEMFVLGVWLFSVGRKAEASAWKETRTVDFEKLKKTLKTVWLVWGVLMLAATIANFFFIGSLTFGSIYGIFSLAGNFLAPFLSAVFPLYISAVVKAGVSASIPVADEVIFVRRKTQNYLIIIGITAVFVLSYAMLYFVTPAVSRTAPEYPTYQQSVKTHSIKNVYGFKTTSDGTQTLSELFKNLPASASLVSVSAQNGEARVEYSQTDEAFDKVLVYNSYAAFALTDGLEKITFVQGDLQKTVMREKAVAECEIFEKILSTGVWYEEITKVVSDDDLADSYAENLIEKGEKND